MPMHALMPIYETMFARTIKCSVYNHFDLISTDKNKNGKQRICVYIGLSSRDNYYNFNPTYCTFFVYLFYAPLQEKLYAKEFGCMTSQQVLSSITSQALCNS